METSRPPVPRHPPVREPEFRLIVDRVADVADGVRALSLRDPAGDALPRWQPGAHIDVLLAPGLERQYSLCGDPEDVNAWRIAVLREPESRGGSEYVHERLRAGAAVEVRGPRNHFPLLDASSYLIIAGGIGITPILPMVRELDARGADWHLVYGGRRRASMAFTDEIGTYPPGHVTIWPEDECGLIDLAGTLGAPRDGVAIYCCGPEGLIAAVEEQCSRWPKGALHTERFRPRADLPSGPSTSFEVVLEYSQITVTVGPDQSIAEAVELAGVDIPTSCREGTCGTCETWVLEGIPDHRDSVLDEIDREANDRMMVCCSRSKTPRLVLDL